MASPLLATSGLGRLTELPITDTTQRTAGLLSRSNSTSEKTTKLKYKDRKGDSVRQTHERTVIIRRQRAEQIKAADRMRKPDTVKGTAREARDRLNAGGLLVNTLA